MCGGDLDLQDKASVGVCQFCGKRQTLPRAANERIVNLYSRANALLAEHEYDQAMILYEAILGEDEKDAEVYWSLVLCKYGVSYIEEPATGKKTLVCNRIQPMSILDDEDFRRALTYSEDDARCIYEAEAIQIDAIQKSVNAISLKEQPYDICICCKELDVAGRATIDEMLAQELYDLLAKTDYRVFFSGLTLSDIPDSQREPYVFSALLRAKVMLVIGTKPEHFNDVWVKSTWERFLLAAKSDFSKLLIPCFCDMSGSDLPVQLFALPKQNMSALGFEQDLLHGLQRVIGKQEKQVFDTKTIVQPLYQNAVDLLEKGKFKATENLCEEILDTDPEFAPAYILKLCAELQVRGEKNLINQSRPLDSCDNYHKALRFAADEYRAIITAYNQTIMDYKNPAIQRERAEQGDAAAQIRLAKMLRNGKGVDKGSEEAAKWFLAAAEQGRKVAQDYLGDMYYDGEGVPQDYLAAENWYRKAAAKGYKPSQYSLAYLFYYGEGVKKNYVEAAKWFRKAAEQGHKRAQDYLGDMCYHGKGVAVDYIEAEKWYRLSADQGWKYAQFSLGKMYDEGLGVEQDFTEAAKWIKKAADQGIADAQNYYGNMLVWGRGVNENYAEAAKWYRKAAEQGHDRAMHNLWYVLSGDHKGVKYDSERWTWLEKSAELGYVDAQKDMGHRWLEAKRYSDALKWYRKAAEQGDIVSENQIGWIRLTIVPVDYAEALTRFRKAADQGLAAAQINLGNMYRDGQGTDCDYNEAMALYLKAAEQDDETAENNIGWMYHNGLGVPLDYKKAVEWYKKAAERGYTIAQDNLRVLDEKGICPKCGDRFGVLSGRCKSCNTLSFKKQMSIMMAQAHVNSQRQN